MINVKKKTIKSRQQEPFNHCWQPKVCPNRVLKTGRSIKQRGFNLSEWIGIGWIRPKKTEIGDNIDIFVKGFQTYKEYSVSRWHHLFGRIYTLILSRSWEGVSARQIEKKIGDHTFSYSKNLKEISIDANNQSYQTIDNIVYDKSGKRLCYCNESREGIFTVNKGIENCRVILSEVVLS